MTFGEWVFAIGVATWIVTVGVLLALWAARRMWGVEPPRHR